MKHKNWLAKEVKQLEEYRLQGKTCKEIGEIMGRTIIAIEQCCKRNQIPRTTAAEKWFEAFGLGLSTEETAKVMGATANNVRSWRYKLKKAGYEIQNVSEENRLKNWRESKYGRQDQESLPRDLDGH